MKTRGVVILNFKFSTIKTLFKLFAFLVFLTISNLATSQPPLDPPDGIEIYGTIDPVPFNIQDWYDVTWTTINNTECDSAYFVTYFKLDIPGTPRYEYIQYSIPGNSQSSINTSELLNLWDVTSTGVITAIGIWFKFGSMQGYMALYPSDNGSKFKITGGTPPCDCFRVYFDQSGSTNTIRIEPIVAPDNCD